jgi:tRNA pseudouridine55 synthase
MMAHQPLNGLLVLDKPGGLTSRAAVDRAQRWFPRGTRLGHTGTLDPLATGVLVLCVGAATRLTEYVQRMDKTYLAGIRLGVRSDTDDADGEVTPVQNAVPPSVAELERSLPAFVGEIDQVPPAFSAAKLTGRRAYDLARRGHAVELAPRKIRIYDIHIQSYEYPELRLEVRCGKGTYIRALARDLGDRLGCGAMIASLRRTRVGPFRAANAVSLDSDAAAASSAVLPMELAVSDLPRVSLKADEATRWRNGQEIVLRGHEEGELAVFSEAGALLGVGVCRANSLRPEKVMSGGF